MERECCGKPEGYAQFGDRLPWRHGFWVHEKDTRMRGTDRGGKKGNRQQGEGGEVLPYVPKVLSLSGLELVKSGKDIRQLVSSE